MSDCPLATSCRAPKTVMDGSSASAWCCAKCAIAARRSTSPLAVEGLLAEQDARERGLARAVLADERDLVALLEAERARVLEDARRVVPALAAWPGTTSRSPTARPRCGPTAGGSGKRKRIVDASAGGASMRSILSSDFWRLCACLALVALARKRSTKRSISAIVFCWLSKLACQCCAPLDARLEVERVVAGVVVDLAADELARPRRHAVEKVAVVRDEDDGAGVRREVLLEPVDGLDVEVVRRLVEQQDVGLPEEQARERDAHAPAAREGRERAPHLVLGEAQPGEDGGRARLDRVRVARREQLLRAREAVDEAVVVVRVVVGRRLHRLEQAVRLGLEREHVAEGAHGVFERRDATCRAPACPACRKPVVAPPSRTTSPPSMPWSPEMTRSSVDLPAPLGPTRPMRSPARTVHERPS